MTAAMVISRNPYNGSCIRDYADSSTQVLFLTHQTAGTYKTFIFDKRSITDNYEGGWDKRAA